MTSRAKFREMATVLVYLLLVTYLCTVFFCNFLNPYAYKFAFIILRYINNNFVSCNLECLCLHMLVH